MSATVPVYVTHELRLDGNDIDIPLADEITDALTIPNQERVKAESRELWQYEKIPEHHLMWSIDGDYLVMPRGFALELKQLVRKHGRKVDWINRTTWMEGDEIGKESFSFRDHQRPAVRAMKRHRQGIYKAPTGSGKTASVCGLIWYTSPHRVLILVDRKHLVTQWEKAFAEHLAPNFVIGKIGDNKWSESRITVATLQTLWARRDQIADSWWDNWDMVVLDECHHVTADTFKQVMAMFSARYRFGVSATPDKTGEFKLAQAVLGPVFHEDSHEGLRDAGILIKPDVKVVYSDFNFHYWGDHSADKKGNCEIPHCKNKKPHHKHRNNYADLRQALETDESRNGLVIEMMKQSQGHTVLIATDHTTHIDAMLEAVYADGFLAMDDIYVLTGKQKTKERDDIIETIKKRGHGFVFSTIANEALDVPSIDRIIMPYPTRNNRKTEQVIGRGTRVAIGKTDCIAWDIADDLGPTLGQLKSRMKGYQRMDLDVEVVNPPQRKKGLGRLAAA